MAPSPPDDFDYIRGDLSQLAGWSNATPELQASMRELQEGMRLAASVADRASGGLSDNNPSRRNAINPSVAKPPLSVPFVNQPKFEPLSDFDLHSANNPLNPFRVSNQAEWAREPEAALPDISGPLQHWNLSGYVDPQLKNPPSMDLPKAMLTPPEVRASTLPDIRARNAGAAIEFGIAAEENRQAEEAFHTPEPSSQKDQWARGWHRARYYNSLPLPINTDVLAAPEMLARYREINELATGAPLLDTPPADREIAQTYIDSQRKLMEASGIDDPVRYVAERESTQGPQNVVTRNLSAALSAAKGTAQNVASYYLDPHDDFGTGQQTRLRGNRAAWQEVVEDAKDEKSALPNWANETARGVSRAAPQLIAAAGVGAATKNPALGWAAMLGPSSAETFQVARSNGASTAQAAGYAATTAALEYLSGKIGGKVASKLGLKTFEELAFDVGKKSAAKSLNPLMGAVGGSLIEGGEEITASFGQEVAEYVTGLDEKIVDESTPEALAMSFAVDACAIGERTACCEAECSR
ncbi:hypothetical protein PLANPX_5315 [Lacipirellula parvula]|uniref:Uncharacterized protein n=1 Tax=Lacipirellula parvula TaxID=2650471 RepID=A0A5K7XM95_9BACT|nr:hypothetical protein PLANPX_5315 [Lacipirellula parvula]